jgi:hypothetical protein
MLITCLALKGEGVQDDDNNNNNATEIMERDKELKST